MALQKISPIILDWQMFKPVCLHCFDCVYRLCPDSNGSIGGVVSMANHCTGAKWGVLSSYVSRFSAMYVVQGAQ